MPDREDPHFVSDDAKDYAVIADAKFPVPAQGSTQRLPVLLRSPGETLLDRSRDPSPDVSGDLGKIIAGNCGMIDKAVTTYFRRRARFHTWE